MNIYRKNFHDFFGKSELGSQTHYGSPKINYITDVDCLSIKSPDLSKFQFAPKIAYGMQPIKTCGFNGQKKYDLFKIVVITAIIILFILMALRIYDLSKEKKEYEEKLELMQRNA